MKFKLGLGFSAFRGSAAPVAPAQMAAPSLAGGVGVATIVFPAAPAANGSPILEYGWRVLTGVSTVSASGSQIDRADVGVALAAGVYRAEVRARNAIGWGAWSPASADATVTAPGATLTVDAAIVSAFTARLALLARGETMSFALGGTQTGGTAPYSWSLTAAPAWITCDAAGTITAAPPAEPTAIVNAGNITLRVQDSAAPAGVGTASIPYVVADQVLGAALAHYELQPQPLLADAQTVYSLTGSLPSGLALCAGGGDFYGVPSAAAAPRNVAVSGGSWTRRWRVSAGKHATGAVFDGTRILCAGSGLNTVTGAGAGGAGAFPPGAVDTGVFSFWADVFRAPAGGGTSTLWNLAGRHIVGIDNTTGAVRVQLGAAALGDRVDVRVDVAAAPWAGVLNRRFRLGVRVDASGASPSARLWIDGREAPLIVTTLLGSSVLDHTRTGVLVGAQSNATSPTNRLGGGSAIYAMGVWFQDAIDWGALPAAALPWWDPTLAGTVDLAYGGTLGEWNAPTVAAGLIRGRCATDHFRPSDAAFTAFTAAAGTDRTLSTAPRAFPDAIGFGRAATGGRGQTVYFVTSTSNGAGAGTLRDALSQPNRYVRWDAEGAILADTQIQTPVQASGSDPINVTIDGRHAPGLGGWLQNSRLSIRRRNVIVHGCQSFPGSCRQPEGQAYNARDAFAIGDFAGADVDASVTENVYLRDCVGLWGMDETVGITNTDAATSNKPARNITIDRCIIAEAMKETIPAYGAGNIYPAQSASALLFVISENNLNITVARSLLTGGEARHPQVVPSSGPVEMINCAITNWGENGAQFGGSGANRAFADFIGCYFLAGANTNGNLSRRPIRLPDQSGTTEDQVYLLDTVFDGAMPAGVENGSNVEVTATGNAGNFVKSGAAASAIAGSAALSFVLAEAGRRRPGEQRHPWAERVIRYHTAPTRWLPADGWAGGNLPQPQELAATGHSVAAAAGTLTLTLPGGTQMTAHPSRPWTGVDFVARLLDANKVPTATRTTVSGPATPGGTIQITGLAAGSYVVEVAWKYSGGEARIRPGREFVVI